MERAGRMEITTRIGCKCNCTYCPQQLLISSYFGRELKDKPDTEMSLETFKKCINKLPKGTRIDFSGMSEPWLNHNCTEMVLYAYEKGYPIAIYCTLVGMTISDFDKIKDIPCEEFVVHIPDDNTNSHIEITQDYIEVLKNVIEYERKDGTRLVTGFSCHGGIHPHILQYIPSDSKLITELHDRAGNLKSEDIVSKKNKGEIVCINCEADIHHNVLLPDGTVLLCCMDYGMKHILGNLLDSTYQEIYDSEEANRIRRGMKTECEDILCRSCVNAKNIYELYDEYFTYLSWTTNLLKQQVRDKKEYREEIIFLEKKNDNIRNEVDEYKAWNDKLQSQIESRVKEANEYKQWVENLQIAKKGCDDLIEAQKNSLNSSKERIEECELVINELEEKILMLEKEIEEIKNRKIYKLFYKETSYEKSSLN